MNIALDYDGTYTADPNLWQVFIAKALHNGHKVYVVTFRFPQDPIDQELPKLVDGVYYTSQEQKSAYMEKQGIHIDVWIDDMPFFIY